MKDECLICGAPLRYFENDVEAEKARLNSGEAQNRAQEDYCNVEIPGIPVIRFQFFCADEKAVNYLIKRIESTANMEAAECRNEKEEYLIDGKVFGKTRIVIAIVLHEDIIFSLSLPMCVVKQENFCLRIQFTDTRLMY